MGDPEVPAAEPTGVGPGQAVLATWHTMLDAGRLQDGEAFLAGTAKRAVARLSAATAAEVGVTDGSGVQVSTPAGAVVVPVVVTDMPDHVVWLPTNSPGCAVRATLRAGAGALVHLSPAPVGVAAPAGATTVPVAAAGPQEDWGVADVAGTHAEHHREHTHGHAPFEQRGHAAHDGRGLVGHDVDGDDLTSGGRA